MALAGLVRTNWRPLARASAFVVLAVVGTTFLVHYFTRYNVAPNALSLLPKTSVEAKLIQTKNGVISYSAGSDTQVKNKIVLADPTNATNGHNLYEASMSLDPGKGLTFSQTTPSSSQSTPSVPGLPAGAGQADQNAKLSFTLTPLGGGVQRGRLTNSRLQYPSDGGQRFYTFRKNGVAEDIILTKAPGDTAKFQWKLSLPSSLEAREMGNGSVGIYSANPELFGNIQVGDQKSQALLDKARKNGAKDTLAFVLPAPFIKNLDGSTDYTHTKLSLKGNIVTLTAISLKKLSYPLSIDPSVVVTTTGDFQTGYDDGMIDYSTTDQVTRANISGGAVGSTSQQTGALLGRGRAAAVAFNGYLYLIGGTGTASSSGCNASGFCNDVQYSWINSNGSLCLPSNHATCGPTSTNVFAQQTGAFTTPRNAHTVVAYNGYIYIVGGSSAGGGTGCNASGFCNDIQYAWVSSTGALCLPSNHSTCGPTSTTVFAQQTSAFTDARFGHTSVVNNGFLYIVGGYDNTNELSDIQYCPLNADGSAGTCTFTCNGTSQGSACAAFTSGRDSHTSVVNNGFLYIVGGTSTASATGCDAGGLCNDIQYCPLNSNGTVGSCTQKTSAFTTTRSEHSSVVYQGYLYVMGGFSGSFQNDIQYCPLNANGSVGTCTQKTSAFTTARSDMGAAVYNGYIYLLSGWNNARQTDAQYLQIQPMGTAGPSTQQTSMFTTARQGHASAVYNGYLYILGGYSGSLQNDVFHCPINASGSIGTCVRQTTAFTTARDEFGSVVSNGYLYIVGGDAPIGLDDVLYAWLDPSTGAACLPSNHATCTGTVFAQQTTAFTTGRWDHTVEVSNGYLYIIGGLDSTVTDHNDIQYGWLNPSTGAICLPSNHATCTGTVFAQQTSAFTNARDQHATAVYNGYLYIIGGVGASNYNDIQYGWLNPSTGAICLPSNHATCTGTVFAQQTSAFTTARYNLTAGVYNGQLYVVGGTNGTDQSDIQYTWLNPSTGAACLPSNHATCTGTVFVQQTSAFTPARDGHSTVLANGFIYIIGGHHATSDTACNSTSSVYCSDIVRMWVGQMGQVGSTTQQTSAFTTARAYQTTVAYNGYLYVIGGYNGSAFNDVQYAPINSNGSVGTWQYTAGGASCASFTGTCSSSTFGGARYGHTSVAYNGYLYIIGGFSGGYRNDVQYAPLNSNGTVGTWQYTAASTSCASFTGTCSNFSNVFSNARYFHTSVAYNGYLYIMGGFGSASNDCAVGNGYCNGVQYAPINSDGTIGTWTATSSFTTARFYHATVAYNGYMYVLGGCSGSAGACTTYYSDVQYALICTGSNSGVGGCGSTAGTVGTWTTTSSLLTAREGHTSVAYNGYLYVIGGYSGSDNNDVQYAVIDNNGTLGNWNLASSITTARDSHTSVVYNGYLYAVGGVASASGTGCTATGNYCSDVQYLPLSSSPQLADYEHAFDTSTSLSTIQSISYSRNASTDDMCGEQLWYATAGSNGQFGAFTVLPQTIPGTNYTVGAANKQYILVKVVMDDSTCGGQSNITSITVNYAVLPSVPSLITPASGATSFPTLTPVFTLRSSQANSDILKYRVQVYQSDCTTLIKDADQTLSSSGWSAASYASDPVVSNSAIASYTYNGTALSWGTQYCWKASANDATQGWSGDTATQSFRTSYLPSAPTLTKPVSSETGVSTTPEFRLYSTDQDNDYLTYEIDIYDSTCTTPITGSPFDENAFQVGWSSQSANSGSAYTSGQTAVYKLQTALTANTQYCWKARAKDPGGTGTFGSFSATQLFTTQGTATPKTVRIGGSNVNIGGNVVIKP